MVSIRAAKAAAAAGVLAGAMLVALPQASADSIATPVAISPYALIYQNAAGVLWGYESDYGELRVNAAIAPGTQPSAAPTPNNYMFVWQGANNHLWSTGAGPTDLGTAMAPGTSPSLVTFPDGTWLAAVHSPDGQLFLNGSSGFVNTGAWLAPGTSPSIAATSVIDSNRHPIPDHYTLAWQGANNHLWLWEPPAYVIDTGIVMAPGTSPSVTSATGDPLFYTSGNYYVAYQGSDGHLAWRMDLDGELWDGESTSLLMAPGASPSTGTVGNGYDQSAFQGSDGHLWVSDVGDTGLPMMAGTTPSLMGTRYDQPGRPLGSVAYYVGYVSDTGVVSLYGYNFTDNIRFAHSTGLLAAAGASPAIVSALNWINGGWVASNAAPAAPAAAGAAAVPLTLPSQPTITPMLVAPAVSDSCPAVRAQLKQYAARGIKATRCESITLGPALAPTAHAVAPHIAGSTLCSGSNALWVSDRTEECIQGLVSHWNTYDSSTGQVVGTSDFMISQDIILSMN